MSAQFALSAGLGIASALSGRSAAKAQKRYYREATGALRRAREIGDEQYDRYKSTFVPIENELVDMSRTIAQPDYAGVLRRATGEYTRSRDQTRDEAARYYARMGVDPSNPMYMRGVNRTGLQDALSLSTARNMAREAERQRTLTQGFDARMSVANIGRGMPGLATNAALGAAGGLSGMGNTYGEMAGGAYGAAGYFANQAMSQWAGRAPTAPGWPGGTPPAGAGDMGTVSANYYRNEVVG